MFTSRNVILVCVIVFLLSVVGGVYSLTRPPDSGGLASDTYGTQALGQRGLFETLGELGLPVERRVRPPSEQLPADGTIVLWGPDAQMVAFEPVHLLTLQQWAESGGRVVVAPALVEDNTAADASDLKNFNTTILEALGLGDVKLKQIEPFAGDGSATSPAPRHASPSLKEFFAAPELTARTTVPAARGLFADWDLRLTTLALPEHGLQVIDPGDRGPLGTIRLRESGQDQHLLVAAFAIGRGQVFVVGDPRLFDNAMLGKADNAVLAVHLLAGDPQRRRVIFDEFYHGLSVRGNPFWLLTRPSYAVLTTVVLLLIGAWTWRQGILLGPPLTTPAASRRAIGEYIEAMARFFNRGRKTRCFLLATVRAGVLRTLAHEFSLPVGKAEPETIVAAIARRDPQRASRLRHAVEQVDDVLANGDNCGERETVHAIQGISACL